MKFCTQAWIRSRSRSRIRSRSREVESESEVEVVKLNPKPKSFRRQLYRITRKICGSLLPLEEYANAHLETNFNTRLKFANVRLRLYAGECVMSKWIVNRTWNYSLWRGIWCCCSVQLYYSINYIFIPILLCNARIRVSYFLCRPKHYAVQKTE